MYRVGLAVREDEDVVSDERAGEPCPILGRTRHLIPCALERNTDLHRLVRFLRIMGLWTVMQHDLEKISLMVQLRSIRQ